MTRVAALAMPFYPHHGPRLIGLQTKQQRAGDGAHIDDHHADRRKSIVFQLTAGKHNRMTISLGLPSCLGETELMVQSMSRCCAEVHRNLYHVFCVGRETGRTSTPSCGETTNACWLLRFIIFLYSSNAWANGPSLAGDRRPE